ncbi:hypothetical protein M413DRAFT_33026 [Hebeloma cylindrosporum]|uniref:Novel STAND NTPase 1 domain-containing protein n=1 Tax=Hebeloma cylindrosporum TaxID=76867 RepID=A0A0C3BD85_HEBCY|nr:hypothetical protein M413DRAFT_33026 [Hebeloma cylindrosporum h7]
MSAGCLSWFRLRLPWNTKKQSVEMKPPESVQELPPDSPAIIPATPSPKNEVVEPEADEKLSKNPRTVVPTTKEYTVAALKGALTVSQSVAGFVPVPFLQEAIGFALNIIQICEEASDVEQKVKELQTMVEDLVKTIMKHVPPEGEEGSKEVVVKSIQGDIEELLKTLKAINHDLGEISKQELWKIATCKEKNIEKVEDCMNRLSTAIRKFTLAKGLHDSMTLDKIEARTRKEDEKIHDNSLRSKTSDALARQTMPMKPEIFHGRDDVVNEIAQLLLQEETARVCILGPGGMGKTSVALAVVDLPSIKERFPSENIIWVPCINATSATLFLEILYTQLQIVGDNQARTLEKIIAELDDSKQRRLILLDNLETPWNALDGKQQQVADILRRLAMLSHIAILATMRGQYAPCDKAIKWQSKTIESTDEAACLRIYYDINPGSENDPYVARLLAALGHMPFAVTLMARLGVENQSTAKDLFDKWSQSGPDILSNDSEQGMNRSICLSVESKLVRSNRNALFLLSILSFLPAGTTQENLRWWAPALESMIPSAITILLRAALLVENKRECSTSPTLFVLPVIRSFMQKQHQAQFVILREELHKACCEFVLAHACRVDDPAFPTNSKVLAAEDTNIQSILFGSPTSQHLVPPSHAAVKALIAFSWHRCDTMPSLEIANRAVTVAKASGVARYIASAVWCLGKTYFQLGDFHLSYDRLQEAYGLFKTLPSRKAELQSRCRCGIDLVNAARFASSDIKKVVSLARKVKKKCAALSNDILHGCSLFTLGIVLLQARQFKKASHYLSRATTVLKAGGNAYNLADIYQANSWVYYSQRKLLAALKSIEEAWKHAQRIDSPSVHAQISLDFARILFSDNRDVEAWKYLEVALMKASYTGDRFNIARASEYMGYGYLRKGDYENAHGAYKAAGETYLGTIYAHDEERCKDNINRIKQKLGNPDLVVGFRRPLIDVDWDALFYPPSSICD